MTENDNNTSDQEETTNDSGESKSNRVEALGEGTFQKSAEANDDDERLETSEYDDGYIPARFRNESRSTGNRRARRDGDTSNE
ncbi:hypothetical protein [Halorientalis persicus]|uniref:hypothetical protein n=1 Tax=Halorientalis persicus TaxID=1367881 RepID=UPI0011141FF1|nr:hypothetical protein [Halorientalis persicus]